MATQDYFTSIASMVGLATITRISGKSGVIARCSCQLASAIFRWPGPTLPWPSVASIDTHAPRTQTSVHMWKPNSACAGGGESTYTKPIAVRDGTPTALHIAAANMEYSVQSPSSVFATCDAGAIATEKFIAFMLRLTQVSMSCAFRHGS